MNDNNISFENLVGQGNGSNSTPPVAPKNNSFNIASLVLGILSIIAACCISEYAGIVFGALSIVFYVMAKKNGTANGMATAGLICGIIGLVFGVVGILANVVIEMAIANSPEYSSLYESIMNMQNI